MPQHVPPNNGGVFPSGLPQGSNMVVADGYVDASPGYVPQGVSVPQGVGLSQYDGGASSAHGHQHYARHRAPMIDPIESTKLTPQITVLLVLSGLARHWKWSLPMGLVLGLLTGGILYLALPTQYTATAEIQIRAVRQQFLAAENTQGRYDDYVNTQLAFLQSPNVIDRALEQPDVARLPIILKQKDKRGWLTRTLSVSPVRRSEIVRISINTDTHDASVKIVNAVIDAYFKFTEEVDRQTSDSLISGLRTEERRQKQIAQNLQDRIRSTTRQAAVQGAAAGTEGMSIGLAQGESLVRDVNINEARLTAMRAQRRGIVDRMNQPSQIPFQLLLSMNPELKTLSDQRDNLTRQREALTQTLTRADDARIVHVDRQIEQINERVRSITSGGNSSALQSMQGYFHLQEEVNLYQLDQEIRMQEIMVEELIDKYNKQLLSSVERAADVLDASFEQSQLSRTNNALARIEDRILAVTTEQRAPARVTPLSRAVPTAPNRLRQYMAVGGSAVIMAFFPLLLSIGIERMKPRLYHVSQVRRAIPQVLIGEIMEPPVSWVHGAAFRKRLARYRESVHNWCTHLLLSDPFRSCKTLSVASVAGDDGKTFLAVQIAVAMAQMKEGKVLLIDSDMRVGRLHLLFGNEETGIGLADVLSLRNKPGEAIVQNEKEPNLELLSAGQLDMSPYELLGDGRFRELLDAMEQSPSNPHGYSLIIVVLPPVANAAESLIMAASTDSTLLCVRQGETVLAAMEDVYRKLVNTGASVDGIVVKDIPYYQMAGRDGGFADRLEQIRLSHLLQYAD